MSDWLRAEQLLGRAHDTNPIEGSGQAHVQRTRPPRPRHHRLNQAEDPPPASMVAASPVGAQCSGPEGRSVLHDGGLPVGALDGRVVIITGAGNGIGRQHALLFASEGARVVVNDLGCDPHGDGADARVATRVVEEIKAAGGEAVANTSDVADWTTGAELVEQALDQFGELHVVVNNAGVLRHVQVADMSENDLDRVLAIHVKGHFSTTRHAAAYWRSRNQAGHEVRAAIVNTASSQGLFGGRNFPQETELPYGIEMARWKRDRGEGGHSVAHAQQRHRAVPIWSPYERALPLRHHPPGGAIPREPTVARGMARGKLRSEPPPPE